jgi:hypothetical protein
MNPILSDVKPDDLVDHLISIRHLLPTTAKERIVKAFSAKPQTLIPDSIAQSKDIDLYDELKQQMAVARGMREALSQLPPAAILGREATSAFTSINSVLSFAHKTLSELKTMERVNRIETAITDAMEGQSVEVRHQFTKQLALLLGVAG